MSVPLEPEIAKATGLISVVAGVISAGVGALIGVIWKKHNQEIKDIQSKLADMVETKADEIEMVRQRDNIAELFKLQREGNDQVLDKLSDLGRTINGVHADLLRGLGERPTRAELKNLT